MILLIKDSFQKLETVTTIFKDVIYLFREESWGEAEVSNRTRVCTESG